MKRPAHLSCLITHLTDLSADRSRSDASHFFSRDYSMFDGDKANRQQWWSDVQEQLLWLRWSVSCGMRIRKSAIKVKYSRNLTLIVTDVQTCDDRMEEESCTSWLEAQERPDGFYISLLIRSQTAWGAQMLTLFLSRKLKFVTWMHTLLGNKINTWAKA